ncbi:MAG: class I SAM-dependent methyltransferase [Anaerolineae bacterium]|nr:class I SAM-dependent methyltransferase [Anaerolineae bacterium]
MLNNLNLKFYNTFASSFTASRGEVEPGLAFLFEGVTPGQRILDLGCGQGRVAQMLPRGCIYVGMDFSEEMVALARQRPGPENGEAHFIVGDLLAPGWQAAISGVYDWIVLRAVLHHIPGATNRQRIVREAAGLLAPEGKLILANWQFLEIRRLRERILPWDTTLGLSPEQLDAGDYLLDWRRDGYGLRYLHLVDEAETLSLSQMAGMSIEKLFHADGHGNNLTLYAVLGYPDPPCVKE